MSRANLLDPRYRNQLDLMSEAHPTAFLRPSYLLLYSKDKDCANTCAMRDQDPVYGAV